MEILVFFVTDWIRQIRQSWHSVACGPIVF